MFRRIAFHIGVALSVLGTAAFVAAEPSTFVVGLDSDSSHIESVCTHVPGCAFLPSQTQKFPNENIFARLKSRVTGSNVLVVLKSRMSADEFMEILEKANAARTAGASRVAAFAPSMDIAVYDQYGIDIPLDTWSLLATAGVEEFGTPRFQEYVSLGLSKRTAVVAPAAVHHSVVLNLTHSALAEKLARQTAIPLVDLNQMEEQLLSQYRAQQPGFQRNFNATQLVSCAVPAPSRVFLVAPSINPVNDSFFRNLAVISALKATGNEVVLITPYLPYARSDKADQLGVGVYGAMVARLIESVGTDVVVAVRMHAPQSQGFFRIPVFNIDGRETVDEFLRAQGIDGILSPDAGFQKDATFYADDLAVWVAIGNKQRDPKTGKSRLVGISMPIDVPSLKGTRLAVIDDETASGSSLAEPAHWVTVESGADSVMGVVSHVAGDARKALESPDLVMLAALDTLPIPAEIQNSPKFRQISVSPEIARVVGYLNSRPGPLPLVADCEIFLSGTEANANRGRLRRK